MMIARRFCGVHHMIDIKKIPPALIRHRSVLLGALLVGLVWVALFYFLKNEHDSSERAAIQNSTNLAGAFEQHLSRSLGEIDGSLKAVRTLYARDPDNFDLKNWLKASGGANAVAKIGVVDRDGRVKLGSGLPARTKADVRETEYFRAQANARADELMIGKPMLDPSIGKWSFELSRRIEDGNGSFNGVVVAFLDPEYLTRIYNSVNIGRSGYIRIIGLDGAVRATSGTSFSVFGKDLSKVQLIEKYQFEKAGWFYSASNFSDNVPRLTAYRKLNNYPLFVTVGLSSEDIFSRFEAQKKSGYLIAAVLSLLIFGVTALSVRDQLSREAAKKHLEQANMLLNAALANMPHGICMFGADKKLVLANDLYSAMYGLDPQKIKPGTTLPEILDARIAAGSCPEDAQKYIADRMDEAFRADEGYVVNKLQDGRSLAISRRPMTDGGSVAVHQDITAHLRAEQQLEETKQFLNSIIENIPIAVVVKDANTRKFILVNRAFEAMLKVPRSEVLGKTVFEIYRKKDADRIDASDNVALSGEFGACSNDYEIEMPDGEARVLATSRIVARDNRGTARHLVVVIDDVTERKKSEQRIAFMAHHDVLTGLPNRLAVMDKIEEAIARHRRHGDQFAVLLLDLDRFKHVNDTLGHAVGDALLRETAVRLKASLRETDVLARLGGDEFAIVQDRKNDQHGDAGGLADRIIEIISEPFILDGHEVNIATSIGIALAPEHATTSDSLMKMADLALYRAKSAGRNGFRFLRS